MTVVDLGAHRRSRRRGAMKSRDTQGLARDTSEHIQSLGVVRPTGPGAEDGAIVATGTVMRHPLSHEDVIAFLIEADSEADVLLQSSSTAEFCVETAASWRFVAGPVELVRANQVQADWFRWMVGEVFAAAGDTSSGLAEHEQTIGIPSTVVAFLRPTWVTRERDPGNTASVTPAAVPFRQRAAAPMAVPGGAA